MNRLALSLLRDPDSARDAVQETTVALWRSRSLLGKADNQAGYCLSSVRTTCLAMIRKSHRMIELSEAESIAAPETSSETADYLSRLLDQLPELQRIAFNLRIKEGAEYEEIAARLGTTPQNARQLLSRARTTLRKLYYRTDL